MEKLLTETDVAKHMGVSTRTLQAWRRESLGPQFLDIGKNTIRYRAADLLAYEKARATGGEIPERALVGLTRASSTLAMILTWKLNDAARSKIEEIRAELLELQGQKP